MHFTLTALLGCPARTTRALSTGGGGATSAFSCGTRVCVLRGFSLSVCFTRRGRGGGDSFPATLRALPVALLEVKFESVGVAVLLRAVRALVREHFLVDAHVSLQVTPVANFDLTHRALVGSAAGVRQQMLLEFVVVVEPLVADAALVRHRVLAALPVAAQAVGLTEALAAVLALEALLPGVHQFMLLHRVQLLGVVRAARERAVEDPALLVHFEAVRPVQSCIREFGRATATHKQRLGMLADVAGQLGRAVVGVAAHFARHQLAGILRVFLEVELEAALLGEITAADITMEIPLLTAADAADALSYHRHLTTSSSSS